MRTRATFDFTNAAGSAKYHRVYPMGPLRCSPSENPGLIFVAPALPSSCSRLLHNCRGAAWSALGAGFLYGLTGYGTFH